MFVFSGDERDEDDERREAPAVRGAEIPHDPALEAMQAKLRRFVIVSMATLGIGLLAVLFAIAWRAVNSGKDGAAAGAPFSSVIELPAGARILGETIDGGRLVVTVEGPEGRSVLVYDLATGARLGEARLVAR